MKRFIFCIFYLSLFAKSYEEPWGKDSFLVKNQSNQQLQNKSIASKSADTVIRFYQNFLSPTTGARSSFRPTSSRYMQLAIQRYGFVKGFLMGCDRLMRENNEKWLYRTVDINGVEYKYDPASLDKH